MLGHLNGINGAIGGMGFLVDKNRPFVNFLVKNWWLVAIAGIAVVSKSMERKKKGELTVFNSMADVGLILSPLVGLALLNQLAGQEHDRAVAAGAFNQPPTDPNAIPTPPMPA